MCVFEALLIDVGVDLRGGDVTPPPTPPANRRGSKPGLSDAPRRRRRGGLGEASPILAAMVVPLAKTALTQSAGPNAGRLPGGCADCRF